MKHKPSRLPQYMHVLRNEAETVPATTRYAILTKRSRNRHANHNTIRPVYHKRCKFYAMKRAPSRLPHDMQLLGNEADTVPSTTISLCTFFSMQQNPSRLPQNTHFLRYKADTVPSTTIIYISYALKEKLSRIPQYMQFLRNEAETDPATTIYAIITQWSRHCPVYHKICTPYAIFEE